MGNSSSHPKLPKRCQARISPKFLKLENAKTLAGSNFPKIPKILASVGVRVIVAESLGILGKFEPGDAFASESAHLPLSTAYKKHGGGGGGVSIYIYTYTYTYAYTYT